LSNRNSEHEILKRRQAAASNSKSIMKGSEQTDVVRRKLFFNEADPLSNNSATGSTEADLEQKSKEWNFDFKNEIPLKGRRYSWEKVQAESVPKFYHETSTEKKCKSPVSKSKIGPLVPSKSRAIFKINSNCQNRVKRRTQNENKPLKKADANKNRISKSQKNSLPQSQKVITQFFRQKNIRKSAVIDLTKSEAKVKEEPPLCDYTNRRYFQTRSTASILTRTRRRKLSHEAQAC